MPTYEYQCDDCGNNFDTFQQMSEDPLKTCHKCKSTLRRVIHGGTTIIFKGSGFYCNDHGKKEAKRIEEERKEEVKAET